jgi:hypothetical protein
VKGGLLDQEGINMAKACLKKARDNGVNLFDNAETYGNPAGVLLGLSPPRLVPSLVLALGEPRSSSVKLAYASNTIGRRHGCGD